ncbi:hypothetical protein BDW_10230 [Bdellovibrio bacteriovorus W]|nr:hypothetical protein BDW_10230 [Bdellovibrio bacteriovorus W]
MGVQIKRGSGTKEKITHYLKSSVLYHNLERVEVLYKNSFGFSLLKDFPDQNKLFKIIHLRHDCVHRNGFNKDGVPIEITKKDLRQTYRIVKKFVLKVQDMVDKL